MATRSWVDAFPEGTVTTRRSRRHATPWRADCKQDAMFVRAGDTLSPWLPPPRPHNLLKDPAPAPVLVRRAAAWHVPRLAVHHRPQQAAQLPQRPGTARTGPRRYRCPEMAGGPARPGERAGGPVGARLRAAAVHLGGRAGARRLPGRHLAGVL